MFTRDNTNTSMRGLLLAAHRNLRKSVNQRSAKCKSQSTAAALQMRDPSTGNPARTMVFQNLHTMRELHQALLDFGGPEMIPQASGFSDYLTTRRRLVHANIEHPCALTKVPPADETQWRSDARKEFSVMFEAAFADALEHMRHAGVSSSEPAVQPEVG